MSISLSSSLLLPKLFLSSLNLTLIGHPQGALTPTKSERGLQTQQKRRRILSINIFEPRKETLLMTYDSISRQPTPLPVPQSEQVLACLNESCQALAVGSRRRGRPATLSGLQLCLGIMLCGLRGFGAQLGLWRLLCLEPIGPFLPGKVGGQAIYNLLERAAGLMEYFFEPGS